MQTKLISEAIDIVRKSSKYMYLKRWLIHVYLLRIFQLTIFELTCSTTVLIPIESNH